MPNVKGLIGKALEARKKAYAPYSNFLVGAALLCKNGDVYTGCNIESASYSPSNCAERTAIFKAVSEGNLDFSAVVIVGGSRNDEMLSYCPPCGVCRQVMMEFCDPETFQIILAKDENSFETYTLKNLLPVGFGPKNLEY